MAKAKPTSRKSPTVDRRLVEEVRSLLRDKKELDIVGHIAGTALCCRVGTVALVKIDKGRPARRG